jgi:hypothetical protein
MKQIRNPCRHNPGLRTLQSGLFRINTESGNPFPEQCKSSKATSGLSANKSLVFRNKNEMIK